MNILISFSGGRTSAFMARFIKEYYKNDALLFVFANTGKENEETLDFVNKCDKEFSLNVVWLEASVNPEKGKGTGYKVVDYKTASRNGEPFEDVIKKYGLPSRLYRHCTRELKDVPIHKYAKSIFESKYKTAVGIRADEKHRISKRKDFIYPLADMNIDEKFIRNWWSKQPFDLKLKDYQGNCDFCFLKSVRKKLTIAKESPEKLDWWQLMENKYAKDRQLLFDVYRDLPVDELKEMSTKQFKVAADKQEERNEQFSLDMDFEMNCFCSNI